MLLALLFVAVISLTTLMHPEQGPVGPSTDWEEKLRSTLLAFPLVGVIMASIGGIYLGIFTPVQAAEVGATLVSVMALSTRAVKIKQLPEILIDTVTMTAMLYLIIIGAHVIGPVLALTHIPEALASQLEALGLGTYGTLMLILVTPPVGINVFVVNGIAANVPMATIFRGVLPFWIATAVCLLLMVLFPQIALYLPDQMK